MGVTDERELPGLTTQERASGEEDPTRAEAWRWENPTSLADEGVTEAGPGGTAGVTRGGFWTARQRPGLRQGPCREPIKC